MTRWRRAAPSHADPWRAWLVWPGSLTRRIVARSTDFHVVVARQGPAMPHRDEHRAIGLARRARAHAREVTLVADGRPVVVAHSVAAAAGLRGPWRAVAGLGTRPLAEVLFSDPRLRRRPFEYARVDRRHPLWKRARALLARDPGPLPARRSLFILHGHRLMVTEVFLPALLELGR
ncbi:MAG TPA: chorismate lyase [Usitatibacter sp.]|nr:chorismate lyase [Usitatibacter sp.]